MNEFSPRVPVAISATFWKASRNEPMTMIVVLNKNKDRKRYITMKGKTELQKKSQALFIVLEVEMQTETTWGC